MNTYYNLGQEFNIKNNIGDSLLSHLVRNCKSHWSNS